MVMTHCARTRGWKVKDQDGDSRVIKQLSGCQFGGRVVAAKMKRSVDGQIKTNGEDGDHMNHEVIT